MSDSTAGYVIILDTMVFKEVAKGNQPLADVLRRYVTRGTTVYIARVSYDQLVTNAPNAYLGGHYREMLKDMKIEIAPAGKMNSRVDFYLKNMEHEPQPSKPGQIDEYDKKGKPSDAFIAAQVVAVKDARLLTLDTRFRNRAQNLGVPMAPESWSVKSLTTGQENPVDGRRRLGLNPKEIGSDGRVLPPRGGGGGGRGGGGGGSNGGSYTITIAPASTAIEIQPSARGQAHVGFVQFVFEGLNFALNLANDRIQRQRVETELERARPQIRLARENRPDKGVLLLFRYRQLIPGPDSIMRPGGVFEYLSWGMGATRDEALEDVTRNPTISRGASESERKYSQEVWLPPQVRTSLTVARCPFPPVAIGRFALENVDEVRFQVTEFNVIGGFDDVHEETVRLSPERLERLRHVEFAILQPPSSVKYPTPNRLKSIDVPLKQVNTSNGKPISVVDLDAWFLSPFQAKAAMVFPIDAWAERVFEAAAATRNYRILSNYINFSMIRWVRPEYIHLIRNL